MNIRQSLQLSHPTRPYFWQGRHGMSVSPSPFFRDAPGAPTSMLLRVLGHEISFSHHMGPIADSRFPPNTWPESFFQGARQHSAPCLEDRNFVLPAHQGTGLIQGPPNTGPGRFLGGHHWGPLECAAPCLLATNFGLPTCGARARSDDSLYALWQVIPTET